MALHLKPPLPSFPRHRGTWGGGSPYHLSDPAVNDHYTNYYGASAYYRCGLCGRLTKSFWFNPSAFVRVVCTDCTRLCERDCTHSMQDGGFEK